MSGIGNASGRLSVELNNMNTTSKDLNSEVVIVPSKPAVLPNVLLDPACPPNIKSNAAFQSYMC